MLLIILAILLGIIGIIGCIVPGLPGPPISLVALLCVKFSPAAADPVSSTLLSICIVAVIFVTVIDYILPPKMTRRFGGHKAASTGAMIGLIAGMFFTPIGMIGGSLLGAFLGELLIENRGAADALKASLGAFLGFILTTGLKLACSGVIMYYIFALSF